MKAIETTLTWILVSAFIVLVILCKADDMKSKAEAAEQAEVEALAKIAADEKAEKTFNLEVEHDSDPNTNTVTLTMSANSSEDPDGDPMSFSWSQVGGATVELGDSTNTSSLTVDVEAGEYEFKVAVSDSYGETCEGTVLINVEPEKNSCPVVISVVE